MDLLREIPDTLEQGCFATRLPDGSVAMMVTGNDTEFNALENVRLLNPEEVDPKRHIYLRIFSHRNTTWVNNPDKTKDPLSNDLSKLPNIGKDGYLERLPDGRVVCFSKGEKKVMEYGSECLNPTAPEAEQIYRKIFSKLKIYLPNEYERAIKEVLGEEPDRFIMSINGYSSLKVKERTDWGLGADEYEAGCEDLLYATIAGLRKRFMNLNGKGLNLKLVDGGSSMGVDLALINVAKTHEIPSLSFSCPQWLMYVNDDATRSVFVGKDSDEYADRYIQTLDFLITTGGRAQALKHDVYAAVLYGKRIHFIDVASALSRNKGVPATSVGADGTVNVENAAAAMLKYITFASQGLSNRANDPLAEEWETLVQETSARAIEACGPMLSAKNRFIRERRKTSQEN